MANLKSASLSSLLSPINGSEAAAERNKRHYRRIPKTDSTRILEIQSGSDVEPISLFADLQDADPGVRPYQAVSFCWSDVTDTLDMLCDSKPFSIARKLLAAIRRLRSEEGIIRLWPDACCINQREIAERYGQVSIMRQIFAQAGQVDVLYGLVMLTKLQSQLWSKLRRWREAALRVPKPYSVREVQPCRKAQVFCGTSCIVWEFVALVARWA